MIVLVTCRALHTVRNREGGPSR